MRFDPPPWHKFSPLGTSVTLISSVIRSYCRAALFAVRRAGAGRSGSDAPPLVFEEVAATPPANDTPSINAISTPSIDAPIPTQLAYAAAKVFGKSALRPRQVIAVNKLVYCQSSKGKLLVVDRTGLACLRRFPLYFPRIIYRRSMPSQRPLWCVLHCIRHCRLITHS